MLYISLGRGTSSIFTGGDDSRNEGFVPYDKNNATIYYNKNETGDNSPAMYLNSTEEEYTKEYLVEDSGGIKIGKHIEYTDNNLNIDSIWYGNCAFMTNSNIQNGEMSFYYSGDHCGIDYAYMSPVPYDTPSPIKACDKQQITKGDELTYSVTQYIPNMIGQLNLNFNQIYKNAGYVNCGDLSEFSFYDSINNNLEVEGCKVYKVEGNKLTDVSDKFEIKTENNIVKANVKDNERITSYFSNAYFKFKIKCKLKSKDVRIKTIPNYGRITIRFGGNYNSTKNTNTVNVNVYYCIKGNVWIENNRINGKKDSYDFNYNGMVVELLDSNYNEISSTRTDGNGTYAFDDKLDGDKVYYVRFKYNGQIYQSTYYKSNFTVGNSCALENSHRRLEIQNRFATIRGFPQNYLRANNQYNVAYGLYQKIVNLDTNNLYYINGRPLTMIDILKEIDSREDSLDNILKSVFYIDNNNTRNAIINYIDDCSITAVTKEISINDVTNIQNGNRIDFGVYSRPLTDLSISNEIVSTTCIVNGKIMNQSFDEKGKKWKVEDRVNDAKYNGKYKYSLPIKSADYLFNAPDYDENGIYREYSVKNLQVYVKYKITIKNNGNTNTRVDYINNWFDDSTYSYNDATCQDENNSYILYGNTKVPIKVIQEKSTIGNLKKMVITGQNDKLQNNKYNSKDYLSPNGEIDIYITFKVNNDSNGKLIIEEGRKNKIREIGKRDVCEIGQYETVYEKGEQIPDHIDDNGNLINKDFGNEMAQGTIDINSNPGSLSNADFIYSNNYGGLNYESNRIENDTDQSELVIKIDSATSKIGGIVFEDKRTVTSNETVNAVIGNGRLDSGETEINGVTVELVELVREVDPSGFPSGNYVGEKIWDSYSYSNGEISKNNEDYYSGIGKSKVIINSNDSNFNVSQVGLGQKNGTYMFDNIPSGDFIVRFKYGDTIRTVLANEKNKNEVTQLLNKYGLNAKSYNGNDYKSTIYESDTKKVESKYGDNTGDSIINNYNDIENFYNNKDYINTKEDFISYSSNKNDYIKNKVKDKLNFYDLNNVSNNDSDAKDLYYYRQRANEYSTNLNNHICEVLDSFEKKVQCDNSTQINRQLDSIKELIENTSMVAQTGLIDTARNNGKTDNVNLGLVERAKSQVVLNQEVSNVRVTLPNGQILYDTNKSVKNLYFGENGDSAVTIDNRLLTGYTINDSNKPSLIQIYMDDELISGANLEITYKVTAEDESEVDYTDKRFYYSGVENNPTQNISKLKISEIVEYVPNILVFDSKDDSQNYWKVISVEDLINSDDYKQSKVNDIYKNTLKTYNTLLTSTYGSKQELTLVPELIANDSQKSKIEFNLKLKSLMSAENWQKDNLTYNNLMEIVHTESDNGRRMSYSIFGNQEMANQSSKTLLNSSEDYIKVKEIDAASSQKVIVLPPTGENKNYFNPIIIAILADIIIIILGIWQIKIGVLEDN